MSRRAQRDDRPLVPSFIDRFDTCGLENGAVNLINHMPAAGRRLPALTALECRVPTPQAP